MATQNATENDAKSAKDAGTGAGRAALEQAVNKVKNIASGAEQASEHVTDEARTVAGKRALQELPYAVVGLGDVVAHAARRVDASTLPERLRRTPVVVGSKMLDLGGNAKVSYLALVARGRALRLEAAGEQASDEAREQVEGAIAQAEDAVEQGAGVAATTLDRARAAASKVRNLATRGAKGAGETAGSAAATGGSVGDEAAGAAAEATTSAEEALDTGTGALTGRTVAQLRNRAQELGIEGRTTMKKDELVQAIRDAT